MTEVYARHPNGSRFAGTVLAESKAEQAIELHSRSVIQRRRLEEKWKVN